MKLDIIISLYLAIGIANTAETDNGNNKITHETLHTHEVKNHNIKMCVSVSVQMQSNFHHIRIE